MHIINSVDKTKLLQFVVRMGPEPQPGPKSSPVRLHAEVGAIEAICASECPCHLLIIAVACENFQNTLKELIS